MKEIKLSKQTEIDIVIKESIKVITDTIQIKQLIDDGNSVKAVITANDKTTMITLWEDQSYTNIGQWTDNDVENRIIVLFS
jgi:hypothetical protein